MKNPILSGFKPDPSICVVDEDYYIAVSSFAYSPGIPIYHSRNLYNWTLINHALKQDINLFLEGADVSEGIFAPTLRYHNGIFYIITTNVSHGGNFIVSTSNPYGEWSRPIYLKDASGIDPSLFFDTDGKCYYTGTRPNPEGVKYNGDWEVWCRELNLETLKLTGDSYKLWKGALVNAIWPEGPHLYKKDGYYYLLIAEGGTGEHHCITIARSKNVFGPYIGNPGNPILTHRHLGRNHPIQNTGHGDMFINNHEKWMMVLLASRINEGHSYLGRETYLAKVTWENGWPIINSGKGKISSTLPLKKRLSIEKLEMKTNKIKFIQDLDLRLITLNKLDKNNIYIDKKNSLLKLKYREKNLGDIGDLSYICLRQKDLSYSFTTLMEIDPIIQEAEAGVTIFQNHSYYITCHTTLIKNKQVIEIQKVINGVSTSIILKPLDFNKIYLKIVADCHRIQFLYSRDNIKYENLSDNINGSFLSTEAAGGFVGNTIGVYATSNHKNIDGEVSFKWIEYLGIL